MIGIVACIGWAFPVSLVLFQVLKRTIGLRVSAEVEEEGLDHAQHGLHSHPEFVEPTPPRPYGDLRPVGGLTAPAGTD
jgi:Amt family ammonium transporter